MTYILEQVSNTPKVSKSGKEYLSCGIKIDGVWYNGFGKPGVTTEWQEGQEITGIILYEDNGFKNWKFISTEERLSKIEAELAQLKEAMENASIF